MSFPSLLAAWLIAAFGLAAQVASATSPPAPVPPPPYAEEPPLSIAVATGNVGQVVDLLAKKASVRAVSAQGMAAIHWLRADDEHRVEILHLLLRAGARIDQVDGEGDTILHRAARALDARLIRELLAAGANVHAHNREGFEPLAAALESDPRRPSSDLHRVLQQLMVAGADRRDVRVLLRAVQRDDPVLVELFIALGCRTDLGDIVNGHSLLTLAARQKSETIALLLRAGLDPNHGFPAFTAMSYVLTEDTSQRTVDTVKLLLEYGARPDAPIYYDATALLLAAQRSSELVDLLLRHGADLELRGRGGKRAFEEAILYAQHDTIRLMIAKGVRLDSADKAGNTALHYAAMSIADQGRTWPPLADRWRVFDAVLEAGADGTVRNAQAKTPFEVLPAQR